MPKNEIINGNCDPNKLRVDYVKLNGIGINLVSCDHVPRFLPKADPWAEIEANIKGSALVFVEYFPPELKTTAYNTPIFGAEARYRRLHNGIDQFFNRVADISAANNVPVAVADIANKPLYELYYLASRAIPIGLSPFALAIFQYNPILGISELAGLSYALFLGIQEAKRAGMFGKKWHSFERFIPDIEDARRVITAKGIEQETQKKPAGSSLTYIAPPVHVARVKWALEHPDDITLLMKSKLYSFLAVGLSKSIREYCFADEEEAWKLTSETKIKL